MLFPLPLALAFQEAKPLLGFTPAHAAEEQRWESRFDASLSGADQLAWLRELAARPHHVGSPYGLHDATFLRDRFREWGFDARIETFYVLFPTPKERVLEMGRFRAKLREPEVKGDPGSKPSREALPTYNAYSCDGDVRGKLVYVNQGLPRDYETLAARGIDVKGKIVIARYGGSWRGIKPKVAAEHGAIGCVIYSDPRDDGFAQGDPYPKGGWRDPNSAQRGSVQDMPIRSGDPLTPSVGATKDAKRIALKDSDVITKIPVLPISYGDALPLLRDLQGPVAPTDWRGALPVTYKLGPSRNDVHLKLRFNWDTVECRDVIATLKGSEKPDEWIVRGNHHDAWVLGANDPLSGQVALLDEARALGRLVKEGWRPKRTIVYCAWDGEEPGLLGSTEFVETHLDELEKKTAVYLNSDTNERGYLGVGGSHSLERFVNEVGRDVEDPEKRMPVRERLRARERVANNAKVKATGDLPISPLGSGSDYSPFLQHAGIASINVGYGGEGEGSQYHSAYDDFEYQTRFNDPGAAYGVVLAKTVGRMAMRLADADTLPFEFTHFAATVGDYVKELNDLVKKTREDTDKENRMIADGTYTATYDPTETHVAPKPKDPVPTVSLKPLEDAVARLKTAAEAFEQRRTEGEGSLDGMLIETERALLGPGLPRRPWYRHTVYAPGFYTGYGVKTLPGVREAIEQRSWKEAEEQAVVAAAALNRLSDLLEGK